MPFNRSIHVWRLRFARADGRPRQPQSVAVAVLQFALSGLAAVAVLGFVGVQILQHTGQSEAINNAKRETQLAGLGIVAPQIRPGLLNRDRAAIARLDRTVHEHVLGGPVVRVKIWDAGGRILYSDEHQLIGSTYKLGTDEMAALRSGGVDAEVSDLSKPENRFERSRKKLLEVYLGIHGPSGGRLLYEDYLSFSSVAASGNRLWSKFAPALLITLAVLALVQIPLAWSLARRLRRRQEERETLLRRTVEASDVERRRLARDLHDGVVQDLVGIAYSLSAAVARMRGAQQPSPEVDTIDAAAGETRQSVRELRTLLFELYPPTLERAGLRAALSDLVAPLQAGEVETEIDIDPALEIPPHAEPVLYRVAQEAVRNITAHAGASHARINVWRENGCMALSVEDDGHGFTPGLAHGPEDRRHFGLRILHDLARDAGGSLSVDSQPGEGTRVRIEVPVA